MAVLTRPLPRRLMVNSGSIFAGEAMTRVATFVMAVVVARSFGAVALGQYGFAVAVASVLLLIPDMGLQMFLVRELAAEPQRFKPIFWGVHWLKLPLLASVLTFVVIFGGVAIRDEGRRLLLYVLVAKVALQTFSQAYMAVFKAFERMQFVAIQQFANAFMVVVWAGVALATHASLRVVVFALVAGQALETWIGWRIARNVFSPGAPLPWDGAYLRAMISASAPIGITAILQALNLRLDILALSPYVSNRELGNFQAAAWFPVGAFLFVSLLMTPVFPKLARLLRSPSPRGTAYVESLLKSGLFLMALASFAVGVLAPHLLAWFFGKELVPAVSTLRILAAALPFIFINTTMFYVFVAAQRRVAYMTALILGVSVGAVLNLTLAASYGPTGSAVADLLREFFVSIIYLCFLREGDFAQFAARALLKVLSFTVVTTALAFLITPLARMRIAWPGASIVALIAGAFVFMGAPRLPELRVLADDDL